MPKKRKGEAVPTEGLLLPCTTDEVQAALTGEGRTVRYNTRAQRIEIAPINPDHNSWTHISDIDGHAWRATLSRKYDWGKKGGNLGREQWREHVGGIAAANRIDPFLHWVQDCYKTHGPPTGDYSLIDEWLPAAFNIAPQSAGLVAWASRNILVGALARTLTPGAKHDELPILVGPQGIGKSELFRHLFPSWARDDWHTSDIPMVQLGTKEATERCLGKVIVVFDELDGIRQAQTEMLKAWLTRSTDTVRLAYRSDAESYKRNYVCVGTSNKEGDALPQDKAGQRRFIPLVLIDGSYQRMTEWAERYREQLWAEAYHLVSANQPTHLHTTELQTAALEAAEGQRSVDTIEEDLSTYPNNELDGATIHFLAQLTGLLDFGDTVSPRNTHRISRAMANLGWVRTRERYTDTDGNTKRRGVYRRKDPLHTTK